MFIRSPYNYDVDAVSEETGLCCADAEDMAQQQFKDECDINEITRRFGLGAVLPEGHRLPQYGDFTGIESFHDACNAIAEAHESFDSLPATLRDRFKNDPGVFVDFVLDDKNRDEAVKLGLIQAKPEVKVASADAVSAVLQVIDKDGAL